MKRYLFILIGLISFILVSCSEGNTDGKPNKIRLDYATYSPISLVLKEFGFLEEELKDEGIEIEWVFSQGSNKALEFLNSNSVDFGSAAGAATLISKVNGAPIKNVYIFSKPEWTALVTLEDENIDLVAGFKREKNCGNHWYRSLYFFIPCFK